MRVHAEGSLICDVKRRLVEMPVMHLALGRDRNVLVGSAHEFHTARSDARRMRNHHCDTAVENTCVQEVFGFISHYSQNVSSDQTSSFRATYDSRAQRLGVQ
ncbi:unnamed protein product [Periconia digitata]|uniref:Uncharacterized protein n=1 Tax=Periconia digitata TaxID=1303443 RepID=A0A9W4UPF0_9PLEO|nr:unnamed protein product [Periconia digitata]